MFREIRRKKQFLSSKESIERLPKRNVFDNGML